MKNKVNDEQGIMGLMVKIQEQLTFLEKKIDTLIGQSQGKPSFQRFDHPPRQRETRQDNNYRDRVLHKAICADCGKECEVPFKPSQDRPVYCRDCFSKRKGGGPWETKTSGPRHADRPHGGEKKKFFRKKRPAVKRRKARGA